MGLNFDAVWQQAGDFRRAAERERSDAADARARSGEMGAFARALQLELDALDVQARADVNRLGFFS